jgi:hypothetical protein
MAHVAAAVAPAATGLKLLTAEHSGWNVVVEYLYKRPDVSPRPHGTSLLRREIEEIGRF